MEFQSESQSPQLPSGGHCSSLAFMSLVGGGQLLLSAVLPESSDLFLTTTYSMHGGDRDGQKDCPLGQIHEVTPQ